MTRSAPPYIAVIGPGATATPQQLRDASSVGEALARAGAVVLTGGHGGVMQAAASGCAIAGGTSIGILPDMDRDRANPDTTYTIATGLGELRNGLLVRAADAVICIALSWGTLSEVALAVRSGVPVVALGGWSLPLDGPIPAATPQESAEVALTLVGSRSPGLGGSRATGTGPPLAAPTIHHLTLTVTDVDRSADWYQALLGTATVVRRTAPDWDRVRMQWASGLVIGVTAHQGSPDGDTFSPVRIGLDHVGLVCRDAVEVRAWAARLDEIGAARGPVEEVAYGWAVTGRDPDNIPVEFFASK